MPKVMKVKLTYDTDCWMCPGYSIFKNGKLVDHSHAGAECSRCGRHTHAKVGSICIGCKNSG